MRGKLIIVFSADSQESALFLGGRFVLNFISNNLNRVVKLLTSMTTILIGPMIVASIYGMNVGLPLQEKQHAFWIVIGVALGVSGVVVYIFWKRDWF